MRKLVIATLAGLLALSATAVAQARTHHATRHRHGHHHARVLHLRPAVKSNTGTPTPGGETAGSVTSFEEGVLTITLNDGTKVMGKVTEDTEINCEQEDAMAHEDAIAHAADHGDGGGHSWEDGSHGSENSPGDDNEQGDDNGQGDDEGEHGEAPGCGIASLTKGALVRDADLRLSSAGAVFEEIELVG
jgi:hypothetical protein